MQNQLNSREFSARTLLGIVIVIALLIVACITGTFWGKSSLRQIGLLATLTPTPTITHTPSNTATSTATWTPAATTMHTPTPTAAPTSTNQPTPDRTATQEFEDRRVAAAVIMTLTALPTTTFTPTTVPGPETMAVQALRAWYHGNDEEIEALRPPDMRGQDICSRGWDHEYPKSCAQGYMTDEPTAGCYEFGTRRRLDVLEVLTDSKILRAVPVGGYADKKTSVFFTADGIPRQAEALLKELSGRWYLLTFCVQ